MTARAFFGVAGTPFVVVVVLVGVDEEMMRSKTESSSWNKDLRFTISREKSRVPNVPSATGFTNSGHSLKLVFLNDTRSRPVLRDSESQTALRKRFQSQASSSAASSSV